MRASVYDFLTPLIDMGPDECPGPIILERVPGHVLSHSIRSHSLVLNNPLTPPASHFSIAAARRTPFLLPQAHHPDPAQNSGAAP